MSLPFIISAFEAKTHECDMSVANDVENIERILLADQKLAIPTADIEQFSLRLWNCAVIWARNAEKMAGERAKAVVCTILPRLRLLAVRIMEEYIQKPSEADLSTLFYCLVHTYKSLLDSSSNAGQTDALFLKAKALFQTFSSTPETIQTLVQLYVWKSQSLISNSREDEAFNLLANLPSEFPIVSSFLVSFVYDKSADLKSIKWANLCLQLISKSADLEEEWKEPVLSLIAQIHINEGRPAEAKSVLNGLKPSINTAYLELKASLFVDTPNEELYQKLISFVSVSNEDKRFLVALCMVMADQAERLGTISRAFIGHCASNFVFDPPLNFHFFVSTVKVACQSNDIAFLTSKIAEIASQITDPSEKHSISLIIYNKALNCYDNGQYDEASQWMQQARVLMQGPVDIGSSLRFISQCYFEDKDLQTSLDFVNESIKIEGPNHMAYVLKLKILLSLEKSDEAFELADNPPPDIDPVFHASAAQELYTYGFKKESLRSIGKYLESAQESKYNYLRQSVHSLFAILQDETDRSLRHSYICLVGSIWKNKLSNIQFSEDERVAFASVAFKLGIDWKRSEKWKRAAEIFQIGLLFAGDDLNDRCLLLFEAVDCFLMRNGKSNEIEVLMKKWCPSEVPKQHLSKLYTTLSKIGILKSDSCDSSLNELQRISDNRELCEICNFAVAKQFKPFVAEAILKRAEELQSEPSVLSYVFHMLLSLSHSSEEIKKAYGVISAFIRRKPSYFETEQLQFFMTRAWNIGVQSTRASRTKDGNWWFQTAIDIMKSSKDLVDLYGKEMQEHYQQYIDRESKGILADY